MLYFTVYPSSPPNTDAIWSHLWFLSQSTSTIFIHLGNSVVHCYYLTGCIEQVNYFLSTSISPARNLIYVRARAEPSSEMPLPSEPQSSLAWKANFLLSPSRACLRFWISFQANPIQLSLDFLAQAGSSFSKLFTLCHITNFSEHGLK